MSGTKEQLNLPKPGMSSTIFHQNLPWKFWSGTIFHELTLHERYNLPCSKASGSHELSDKHLDGGRPGYPMRNTVMKYGSQKRSCNRCITIVRRKPLRIFLYILNDFVFSSLTNYVSMGLERFSIYSLTWSRSFQKYSRAKMQMSLLQYKKH